MKILVVAAHPDDEVLGCGGTIARLVGEGHEVEVFFLSLGVGSREERTNKDMSSKWIDCEAANKILGSHALWVDLPDNQFDTISRLRVIQQVEFRIEQYEPDIIYTHSIKDLNIDHRITAQAVLTATRPPTTVKEIYSFEVPSSTEWAFGQFGSFEPNYFVDVTDYIDKKIDAMDCYKTEIRTCPHPRSGSGIIALGSYRGGQAGVDYAEAFELIRGIK